MIYSLNSKSIPIYSISVGAINRRFFEGIYFRMNSFQ
jgi:hypothetical protein